MKKLFVPIIALIMLLMVGCVEPGFRPIVPAEPTSTTLPASLDEKGNFRFLISDERNAIDDFASLYITISSIGLHRGGASENASDNWTTLMPAVNKVDLKQLIGDNAIAIWAGNVAPGTYNKVFINVTAVSGVLATATNNQSTSVKLPSGKLQISRPFTISASTPTSFVFDVTVVAAGNAGKNVKYILKPQIDQSGPEQNFKEVKGEGKERPEKGPGLRLSLDGKAEPGAKVTMIASVGSTKVEGAVVTLNGKEVGITDSKGRLTVTLPTTGEAKIAATSGQLRDELRLNVRAKGKAKG